MKCPHCRTAFDLDNARPEEWKLGEDGEALWAMHWVKCPTCERFIIHLIHGALAPDSSHLALQQRQIVPGEANILQVHPLGTARPLSPDVPSNYAERFQKAVRVLPLAADASAALSRRLLQDLIREEAKITRHNLNDEIAALLESNAVPSDLANDVDAIRTVGNFGAHSIKSQSTGEVVDVEPGESDWLLDVLEALFDFYFVRPAASRRRREKLNEKLKDAGKPELKAAQS